MRDDTCAHTRSREVKAYRESADCTDLVHTALPQPAFACLDEAVPVLDSERLKPIVQPSPLAIIALDPTGVVLSWNPAAERLFGWREHEVLGVMNPIVLSDRHGASSSMHEQMLAGMGHAALEARCRRRDGTPVDVSISTAMLYDGSRKPAGTVGVLTDITEHKQAERTIRRYAQRLDALHEIDQAILAIRPPQATVRSALRRVREMVPCQLAALLTCASDGSSKCRVLADYESAHGMEERTIRLAHEDGKALQQLRWRRIYRNENICATPKVSRNLRFLRSAGMHSIVLVSMISKDEPAGALLLAKGEPGPFDSEQIEIATEVAAQLGVAMQNARLFAKLQRSQKRLRGLSRRLLEAQEIERRRIAGELHDEIGQSLTGLTLIIGQGHDPSPQSAAADRRAQGLIDELMARVRDLSLDLRPAMLDDQGLLPALLWHAQRFTGQTQIRVAFRHSGLEGKRFTPDVETAAYRIVQEALTNTARHAGVAEVGLRVAVTADVLTIRIEDHGRGFDATAVGRTVETCGISGMRERAHLLGGRLSIESALGRGTRVTALLPIHGSDGCDSDSLGNGGLEHARIRTSTDSREAPLDV